MPEQKFHRSTPLTQQRGESFRMIVKIIKWISLPALLLGAMFSRFAGIYELPLDLAGCLIALIIAQRVVSAREYLLAAGFVVVAVIYSPVVLVMKLMLLMGVICVATLVSLFSAWKAPRRPPT